MSLDLLAAGLTSLHEIAGDGNEHAEPSTEKELILSGNCIKQVRPSDFKGVRRCLRVLDLSCNELKGLEGLQGLCALQELRLAYNHIECLEGQMNFWGQRSALKSLDLRCNRIAKLAQLLFLGGSTKLEEDQELPAAEAVQKEEARALTEEESCWEELLRSEKNELSLAARWKRIWAA
eukprot:g6903.t1